MMRMERVEKGGSGFRADGDGLGRGGVGSGDGLGLGRGRKVLGGSGSVLRII